MKRLATILFALLLWGCNITPALSHILVGDCYNERKTIEYKVTHYAETFLVIYFYIDRDKMVYYMEKF